MIINTSHITEAIKAVDTVLVLPSISKKFENEINRLKAIVPNTINFTEDVFFEEIPFSDIVTYCIDFKSYADEFYNGFIDMAFDDSVKFFKELYEKKHTNVFSFSDCPRRLWKFIHSSEKTGNWSIALDYKDMYNDKDVAVISDSVKLLRIYEEKLFLFSPKSIYYILLCEKEIKN